MPSTSAAEPLQQRIRDRMVSEVAETAINLFMANGFDETTVDEICRAAGLSRRTFFRYFRGKEDVVVSLFARLAEQGCASFVAQPDGDDVWTALRRSMDPFTLWTEDDRSRALAMLRLVEESSSLRASYLDRVDRWRASLATVIGAKSTGADHSELQNAVIAAASMGAYVAAARAWAQSGGTTSLGEVFDEAFGALVTSRPSAD